MSWKKVIRNFYKKIKQYQNLNRDSKICTAKVDKIALGSKDNKIIKTCDCIKTYVRGGEKNLIQKINKNKHRELKNKNKVKELLICK